MIKLSDASKAVSKMTHMTQAAYKVLNSLTVMKETPKENSCKGNDKQSDDDTGALRR